MFPAVRFAHCFFPALALAGTILAQPQPAQPSAASIAGRWVGVLDIVHSNRSVEPDSAYFELMGSGSTITGSAGNSAQQLSPIGNGKLSGGEASFDVTAGKNMTFHFVLSPQADHLTGTVTGMPLEPGSHVAVDVARADRSWQAQVPVAHTADELYDTVAKLDKQLFDAYNACDLTTLGTLVTDDLEFYHDKTGLAVGKPIFLKSIHDNICGKVHRTLIPGSLEAYPLAHYGAVEIGRHRFSHPGLDDDVGEAKFITIWQNKDGQWKVSRVISYDHGGLKK